MANRWRCGVCGYRLEAATPPETCPSCHEKCDFIDDTPYVPPDEPKPNVFDAIPEESQPRVDAAKCTGCGNCVEVCVVQAIEMRDNVAFIDPDICCGDGSCVMACPVGAIREPD